MQTGGHDGCAKSKKQLPDAGFASSDYLQDVDSFQVALNLIISIPDKANVVYQKPIGL